MTVNQNDKITRLVLRLKALISILENRRELTVHSKIDQFYYMTKVEELMILQEQCENEKSKLDDTINRIDNKYSEIFMQWQKDARWLNIWPAPDHC